MNNYNIQSVSRALDLLEQFVENNTELGITDLSTRLNIQKNNVFRLVATLKSRNYIEINDETGKYRLGLKTRVLGTAATSQTSFINLARPVLNNLKVLCRENCYVAVQNDFHAYYLDGVESDLPVRAAHRIGSSLPLYGSAAGKIILSYLSQEERNNLLNNCERKRFTQHTIIDPETLQEEFQKIRLQGYAIEDQEHDIGVMEIAAPIFDCNGIIAGSLCISGPVMRLAGALHVQNLIPLLKIEAAKLSSSMGQRREPRECIDIVQQSQKKLRTCGKVVSKVSRAARH